MIHPRHIQRRNRAARYVLLHRSPEFSGFLSGLRFENGQSVPANPMKASQVAASQGRKIAFGFCSMTGETFGEVDEARLAAARARLLGPESTVEMSETDRLAALFARVAAKLGIEQDEGYKLRCAQLTDHFLEGETNRTAELDAFEVFVVELEGDAHKVDHERIRSHFSVLEGELDEDEAEEVDGETLPFTDEDMQPLEKIEVSMFRSTLEAMTKSQIDAWAQDVAGLSLDTNEKKVAMIDAIFASGRVKEAIEPESEGA